MIAVVTGGSGFIGQNLVRRLLHDGHEVRCLSRPDGRSVPSGAAEFVVRFDDPRSLNACDGLDGADLVVHLAAATRAVNPGAFEAANVLPTLRLLEALIARGQRPRFLFVSSQAAAGPARSLDRPTTEEDIPSPVEAYGRSKLAAERVVAEFADRLPVTTVRPCAVLGPWDRDFLTLFRMAALGFVTYPGVADHWLSVLHVDDVVDGLLAASRSSRAVSRAYFLASDQPVQWRTLGALIASAVGRPARHFDLPRGVVRGASIVGEWIGRLTRTAPLANRSKGELARHPIWVCSASRATEDFGFRQSRLLPEALYNTYYWYCLRGWLGGSRRADTAMA